MPWFKNAVASTYKNMRTHVGTEVPIEYFVHGDSTGLSIEAIVTTIDDSRTSEEDRTLNYTRISVLIDSLDLPRCPYPDKDTLVIDDIPYAVKSYRTYAELIYEVLAERSDISTIGKGRRTIK